jgi:hypothetical protein
MKNRPFPLASRAPVISTALLPNSRSRREILTGPMTVTLSRKITPPRRLDSCSAARFGLNARRRTSEHGLYSRPEQASGGVSSAEAAP